MDPNLLEIMSKAAHGQPESRKAIADGFGMICSAIAKRRSAFLAKKKEVEDDISSGSRLTKHRLPL